jgi:undecaprenyl diphosphate synthase
LRTEIARLVETRTRLTVIGRRDRLPDGLASEIAAAEGRTASGLAPPRPPLRAAAPAH